MPAAKNTTAEAGRTTAGDPAVAEDVVALLTGQHGRIRSLFEEVRAAEGEERADAFRRLAHLLAVHEAAEEEIVHPVARGAFDGGEDVVEARLAEERTAKEKLSLLEAMETSDPRFVPALLSLRNAVLVHARAEERYEFALLRRTASPARLALMARAVRAAEAAASVRTRPGPGSPRPRAAVADRAREAARRALGAGD